ncbi:MAG: hypothetical protein KKH92_08105 [Firmicutes bacterium]|nr:hypothetical protein [Bacillota bacterium]
MHIFDYLQSGDPVTTHLTKKYLLDQESSHHDSGFIKKYLDLFDSKTNRWGNGVYGPKWISTHYTTQELNYMEISPNHPIYQKGLKTLIDYEWVNKGMYNKTRRQDMCIVGMLVSFITYGNMQDPKLEEMIDYILSHQFLDGGWNCTWDSGKNPKISSVHTTLSVLEGLSSYDKNGYSYQLSEVKNAIPKGISCLLDRDLFKDKKTGKPIHPKMVESHYPPRWKYDILRVLDYLATIQYPYDPRMEDAIQMIISKMKNGYMPKGSRISGLIHFPLETDTYARFNTIRALKVLKLYKPQIFKDLTA